MNRFVRIVCLVVVSLVVTTIAIEQCLRFFQYTPQVVWWQWVTNPDNQKYVLDVRRIYRLKNNIVVDFENSTPTQKIDGHGRRSSPCVPGSETWLFIGDSFIYGHGVNDDQTFPAYIYKEMMDHGRQICVVNAGVQGYSLGPSYVALQEALLSIKPDVVVWGIRPDDFLDTTQGGVIQVTKGNIVVRGAWTSGVFLQGILNKTVGRIFPQSLVLNAVMYGLQVDRLNDKYINTQIHILPYFVSCLHALSQNHQFTLYYVITPSKSIVIDPMRKSNPENIIYASLQQALREYGELSLDMNASLSPIYFSRLKNVVGVRTEEIFQPDGHLAADGNMLMGKLFYETIRVR